MQGAKQKVKDMASAAKQHAHISEAKVEEKAEKATTRTEEEKEMAKERRKVKEAEAKADLHASKAHHVEEKLQPSVHIPGVTGLHHPPGTAPAHMAGVGQQPVGTAAGATHHVPGHTAAATTTTTTTTHLLGAGHHLPGRRLP